MRVGIITLSDSAFLGQREDESGAAIEKIMQESKYQVVHRSVLPDSRRKISEALKELCDSRQLDLIVTTGGTGLSPSDQTPEATMDILERIVPRISEALRWNSMRFTPRAMLSRGVAGIRKNTLVINLPGSPQAVEECLRFLLPALSHGLEVLKGNVKDCAKDR